MIESFGLKFDFIYDAVCSAGSNIKYMLKEGLHLNWEWCIPHLSNDATKLAWDTSKSGQMQTKPHAGPRLFIYIRDHRIGYDYD